jgi:hypothetical protein
MLLGPLSINNLLSGTHGDHSLEAQAAAFPLTVRDRFIEIETAGDAASNPKSLIVDENFVDPEHHCEFCTRLEYHPGSQGEAGYAYKDKVGLDLSGAKKASFWIMGEAGGEKVKFELAGKKIDTVQNNGPSDRLRGTTKNIFNSDRFTLTTQEVTLDKDWKKYEVNFMGLDLKAITSPFAIDILGKGTQKQVVYLKGLIYDDEPAKNALGATTLQQEQQSVQPMTADIISNATAGVAPATFDFRANVSGGTEPYSFKWNFNDEDNNNNTSSRENHVIHKFTKAKDYNITLDVTDVAGHNASDSITIDVGEPTSATIIEENETKNEENNNNNSNATTMTTNNTNTSSSSSGSNSSSEKTTNSTGTEQEAPITEPAKIEISAGGDIVAQPGDIVALNAQVTGANEEIDNTVKWTQTSGPRVNIDGADTLEPRITIPKDITKDDQIKLGVSASLGSAKDSDSTTVFVKTVDEIKDAHEETLHPLDTIESQWKDVECDDLSKCMADDSAKTFSTATPQDAGHINLFSFEKFDIENAKIEYVTAAATARTDRVAYLDFIGADNDDKVKDQFKPSGSISINSDSDNEYTYVWKKNPATDSAWTTDTLNSFLAGYAYSEGKSQIMMSEFSLIVTYTLQEQPPAEIEAEPSAAQDAEQSSNNNETASSLSANNTTTE